MADYTNSAPATAGNRLLAYLIDALVGGALAAIVGAITGNVQDSGIGQLLALIYFLTKEALPFLGGQSIGKKLMKIRVVTEDGNSVANNWGASAIRAISLIVPLLNLYELYLVFTNKPRLGDQWAKTRVVAEQA
ncbi:MAG: RDD family protein [Bacteroidia bacterium]|nr:RDD family protein [Bacteroidia bacterium]